MTGHIRKRVNKTGITCQIILDKGVDLQGRRIRDYITVNGTKREAQQILSEKLNEYNKGTYIEPSEITVDQHLEQWLDTYVRRNLAPYTVDGYTTNIKRYILPYIGTVKLQKLMPLQVQRMYDELQKKGYSPRTIRYAHTTLREALQHAFKMQLIPRNPADFVTLPKQVKYKAKVYEEDEVLKMLEAAKGSEMEAPLNLAVGLGLRRGELLALKWCDIDFEKNQITICRNLVYSNKEYIFRSPKSESGNRVIEMPSGLAAILKRHRKRQLEDKLFFGTQYVDEDLVCCRLDGSPYRPGSYSHKFERFLKSKGLRRIRLHDLRHTNASLMLMYNVPAKVASQLLGHSSIGITLDLYSHVIGELQTEAARKIDTGIFKKLEQKPEQADEEQISSETVAT